MRRDQLSKNIKKARKDAGLSQEEAARRAMVQSAVLGRIEREESDPRVSTLVRISQGIGVSIEAVVRGIDDV